MTIEIKPCERIDDLQLKELKIIQNPNWFCFGLDAVLLANYAEIKSKAKVVDLGTGTAIVPLLIYGKKNPSQIIGIEVQEEVADMARRSIELNNVRETIQIETMNLKEAPKVLGKAKFDVVTTNPPYMPAGKGIVNPEDQKAISRHELLCDLEDVIRVASELLNTSGKFFMVHRPLRLVDMLLLMRKYDLEPKNIQFVHPNAGKQPNLMLIKAIKKGSPELKIDKPLYVYDENGNYTKEIHEIYDGIWEEREK